MIAKTIAATIALAAIALFQPAQAQSNNPQSNNPQSNNRGLSERELRDLYNLCTRFPQNPRCAGYDIPIPLEQRPGIRVTCSLAINPPSDSTRCKMAIAENRLLVYVEAGEPVELLDNQPGTQEIIIPIRAIASLNLQVWRQTTDTTSFFLGGVLYTSVPKDFMTTTVDFNPNTDRDERSAVGGRDFAEVQIGFITNTSAPGANRSNVLEIAANEDFGIYLLQQLSPSLALSAPAIREQLSASEPANTSGATAASSVVDQLKQTNACIRCDLRGANLQGANLKGANLEGANLQGANLTGANLEDAYLVGANLSEATLAQADLSGTRLTAATLTRVNLEQGRLRGTDLQNADLQGANLRNAEVGGAILQGANLATATLEGADLSDVTVSRGWMPFLGLSRFRMLTNLRTANLQNANLTNAKLDNAWMLEANLSNARLTGVDLDDVSLTGAVLCGATLPNGSTSDQGC